MDPLSAPTVTIELDDIELLTESVQVRVDASTPNSGLLGPCTLELVGLDAQAFGLVLREALDALETRIQTRIAEVLEDRSPIDLCEDRKVALPLALKLHVADRRNRLRTVIESAIVIDTRSGRHPDPAPDARCASAI